MRLWSALAILALSGTACERRSALSPLEAEVTNRLGGTQFTVGSSLRLWTNSLERAWTVRQEDGGNTFFYWPGRGIGVFCHPLYRSQYNSKNQSDWTVTSVFIPLQTNLHPRIPPVKPETRVAFTKLLFDRQEVIRKGWTRLRKVRVFEEHGVLEALEITKPDSLLGDYD